jgi:PIN domain nuclease of toxin-antitoxin system
VNLLLDTHCLIWALADSPALGEGGRQAIRSATTVWFSEASIWEIGLKWRKGKIGVEPRRVLDQALRDGFRPMPLDLTAILASGELQQAHGDPFDRLLYAQATRHDCSLLTYDRTLAGFGTRIFKH